jgi:hypothetical protein
MQNKVLRTTGSYPQCTPFRNLHTAFKLQFVYDYITKLRRHQAEVIQKHDNENVCNTGHITKLRTHQAEVIQKHDNENVRNTGQGKAQHIKYKRLTLGGGQAYDRSID